jgi:deoxyribodipyrimidine photo-lyase
LGGQRGGGRASGRMTTTSIVWFRRDQRLTDNPAWALGTQSDHVVPLFVIDPALFDVVSDRRRSLLVGGLRALDRALARHGGRLRVEHGDPRAVVPSVAEEKDADMVHVSREVTPFGVARDRTIAASVRLERSEGHYLHPPGSILRAPSATGTGSRMPSSPRSTAPGWQGL